MGGRGGGKWGKNKGMVFSTNQAATEVSKMRSQNQRSLHVEEPQTTPTEREIKHREKGIEKRLRWTED